MTSFSAKLGSILKSKIRAISLLKFTTTLTAILILVFLYKNGYIAPFFVGGEPITLREISRIIKDKGGPKNAIDKLIAEKIIEIEAKKRNIMVRSEEIEEELLLEEKRALENGKTLLAMLEESDETIEDLKNNIKLRITLYKILRQDIDVTEEEIDAYIEKNKVIYEEKEKKQIRDGVRKLLLGVKIQTEYETWIREAKAATEINFLVKN